MPASGLGGGVDCVSMRTARRDETSRAAERSPAIVPRRANGPVSFCFRIARARIVSRRSCENRAAATRCVLSGLNSNSRTSVGVSSWRRGDGQARAVRRGRSPTPFECEPRQTPAFRVEARCVWWGSGELIDDHDGVGRAAAAAGRGTHGLMLIVAVSTISSSRGCRPETWTSSASGSVRPSAVGIGDP